MMNEQSSRGMSFSRFEEVHSNPRTLESLNPIFNRKVRADYFSRPTGFVPVYRGSVQSPCPQSRVLPHHVPCIRPLSGLHVSEDPIPARSREWGEAASSNHLLQKAGQCSVIQTRLQPARWLYREVSAESKSLDESQWQGIREYTAMVSPTTVAPQPIQQCGHMRYHAKGHLPGAHRPADWCLRQSPAAAFIADIANVLPGCSFEVGLKSLSPESGLAELEASPPLMFSDDTAKAFFHKGFQCRMLLGGKLPCLFQEAIR